MQSRRAARHSAPLYRPRRSSFGFCLSVCIRKIRSDAKVPFPMCRKSRFQHGELVYFARRLSAMGLRRHQNIIPHQGVLNIYESRLLPKHTYVYTKSQRVWLRRRRVHTLVHKCGKLMYVEAHSHGSRQSTQCCFA